MKRLSRFSCVGGAISVLAADQAIKACSAARFGYYQKESLLGHWLYWSRIANLSIVREAYNSSDPADMLWATRYLPTLAWLAFLGASVAVWRQVGALGRAGLTLIAAAGASNLLDQWRQGYVLDTFMIWQGGKLYTPFNLADCLLCGGAALAAASMLTRLFESSPDSEAPVMT